MTEQLNNKLPGTNWEESAKYHLTCVHVDCSSRVLILGSTKSGAALAGALILEEETLIKQQSPGPSRLVMPSNHLNLCRPLLLVPLQSFPASGSLPMTWKDEQLDHTAWLDMCKEGCHSSCGPTLTILTSGMVTGGKTRQKHSAAALGSCAFLTPVTVPAPPLSHPNLTRPASRKVTECSCQSHFIDPGFDHPGTAPLEGNGGHWGKEASHEVSVGDKVVAYSGGRLKEALKPETKARNQHVGRWPLSHLLLPQMPLTA